MDFRKDINGVRAVAVLSVLLFHFGADFFSAGFVGVDIFFVISGFLMSRIIFSALDRGDFAIKAFLWARVIRLYPALLFVVLAVFAFGYFFVEPVAFRGLAAHGLSSLLFYSNLDYAAEAGYFDSSSGLKWFLHTWSLSVEWQFYILYPLALILLRRLMRLGLPRIAFLGVGFSLSLLAAIICGAYEGSPRVAALGFYSLPSRAYEMIAGGLLAVMPDARRYFSVEWRRLLEAAGLALMAVTLVVFEPLTPWPTANALLPCAATALVLFAAAERSLLSHPVFQFFGNISYSLYLWHWPVVVALHYHNLDVWEWKVAGLGLSVMLGWFSYMSIENPSRIYFRGEGMSRRAVSIMATSAITVVISLMLFSNNLPKLTESEELLFVDASAAGEDRGYPVQECGGFPRGNLRPCMLGDATSADTVIFGDSFAEMWYPRAQHLLQMSRPQGGIIFLTYGGCPPISNVDRREAGFNCADFHRSALDYIKSKEGIKKVIVVSMWTAYFGKYKTNTIYREGDAQWLLGTPEGFRRATLSLERDIRGLEAAGIEVYLSTTSPYPAFDVSSRIREAIFRGEKVDDIEFVFSSVTANSMPIDGAIQSLASPMVHVISLGRNFCEGDVCSATRNGKSLYSDGAHMRESVLAEQPSALDSILLRQMPRIGSLP